MPVFGLNIKFGNPIPAASLEAQTDGHDTMVNSSNGNIIAVKAVID